MKEKRIGEPTKECNLSDLIGPNPVTTQQVNLFLGIIPSNFEIFISKRKLSFVSKNDNLGKFSDFTNLPYI